MLARAADVACARPVLRCLQGFGRTPLEVRETSREQARHGRAGSSRAQQTLECRNQRTVDAVGLGPGEEMRGQSPREFGINRLGDPHEIGDDAGARCDAVPASPLIEGREGRIAWE